MKNKIMCAFLLLSSIGISAMNDQEMPVLNGGLRQSALLQSSGSSDDVLESAATTIADDLKKYISSRMSREQYNEQGGIVDASVFNLVALNSNDLTSKGKLVLCNDVDNVIENIKKEAGDKAVAKSRNRHMLYGFAGGVGAVVGVAAIIWGVSHLSSSSTHIPADGIFTPIPSIVS